MAENTVRLSNGQRWTAQKFVDHYLKSSAPATRTPVTGPPSPVDVNMSWYMDEGMRKYYNPRLVSDHKRLTDIIAFSYIVDPNIGRS